MCTTHSAKNVILILFYLITVMGLMTNGHAQEHSSSDKGVLKWETLKPIPDSIGRAGGFAGIYKDSLLFAGGANFPERMPWEGGTKIWHDTIYILPKGKSDWVEAGRLHRPLGYGVSVSTPKGIVLIGGSDAEGHYADAFLVTIENDSVTSQVLPSLPVTLANSGGTNIGNKIYVVGGTESPDSTDANSKLFFLDLDDPSSGWKTIDGPTEQGRILPVVTSNEDTVYVFSGASLSAGPDGKTSRTYLKDSWAYNMSSGWKKLADMPKPAVAAPSFPTNIKGNFHIFVVGGDDGSLVNIESPANHPGFPGTIFSYHAITDSWANRGSKPQSVVTVPGIAFDNSLTLFSGELKPGIRSPKVEKIELIRQESSFGFVNWATLVLYLLLIMGIGWYCSAGNTDTNEFFRGGQKIPWWAAGISIFATTLSSITFMAVPAKAYSEDWVFMLANLPILLIAPFLVYLIIPVFRRIDATSAYEYLERRFNVFIRIFGSLSFLLLQLGRMAVVLFLPSLALATVTDINVSLCILLMGILTVIYCVMGGVTAVIWTDVIQTFIFLGGALITLLLIVMRSGGIEHSVDLAVAGNKFHLINWSWDYAIPSLWVVIIGNIFANLIPYTSDQGIVQRYMTTSDEKKSAQSVWLNAFIAIPATVLFFSVGTGLYVYYKSFPEKLVPGFQTDAIYPLFIANELPIGIAGLVVAGIFAVAQSTVSTSINSMSTVVVTDFYERFSKIKPDEIRKMVVARWSSAVWGIVGTLAALLLAQMDIKSLWDLFLKLLGLTGSALAGLFMLGIFTTKSNGTGATVGAIVSVITLYYVQTLDNVHFFLYGMIGIICCFTVGYLVSLFVGTNDEATLDGLTVHTLTRDKSAPLDDNLIKQ